MSLRSLYVGENKTPSEHVQDYEHLHGDCLLHLLLFLSLSVWVICGSRSAAPTHSSPIPATKSEFWNCKRSHKQDWLQLSLLIAAPMCSNDLLSPSLFPFFNNSTQWPSHMETRQIMIGQESIAARLSFLFSPSQKDLEMKRIMYLEKRLVRDIKPSRETLFAFYLEVIVSDTRMLLPAASQTRIISASTKIFKMPVLNSFSCCFTSGLICLVSSQEERLNLPEKWELCTTI